MLSCATFKSISTAGVILVTTSMSVFASSASAPTGISKASTQNNDTYVQISATSPAPFVATIASPYQQFVPKPQTNPAVIDYEVLDSALRNIVLRFGQSIRKRESRPDPLVGTRIVKGHKSAYRLEGSRVTFSYLNDEYRSGLTDYRKDLEQLADSVDITRLSSNEQLAFWLNLHNVTLIEQIASNYPVKSPEKLLVGASKQPLNDAKLLNIRGVPMSLRDIRENIVFPNWSDPDVIYGFFRGNIGGPSLQNYAFTGNNVNIVLDIQANEFVNSLRGVNSTSKAMKVSTLYEEARPYYFTNWPIDLKTHLKKFANPDVLKILDKDKPVKFDRYDPVVADLLAGDTPSMVNLNLSINGRKQKTRLPLEVARLLQELQTKTRIMGKRGMLSSDGVVTIDDIDTIDVEIPDVEQGEEP
jgi:Protein of unknown function, DUF547